MGYFPYQLVIAGPFWILGDLNLNNPGAVQTPNLPPPGTRMPGTPRFLTSVSFFGENVRKAHWHTMRTWNPGRKPSFFVFLFRRNQFMAIKKPSFLRGGKDGRGGLFRGVSWPAIINSLKCLSLSMFFVATRESFRYIEEGKFRSLFW